MDPQQPKTFGDWLRQKRIAANLSLEDVAARAGISKQRLSDIENNKRRTKGGQLPKLREDKLEAVARAVFATVEEARLAAGLSARGPTETDLQTTRLISYFSELSEDQKDMALAVIETLWRRHHAQRKHPAKKSNRVVNS